MISEIVSDSRGKNAMSQCQSISEVYPQEKYGYVHVNNKSRVPPPPPPLLPPNRPALPHGVRFTPRLSMVSVFGMDVPFSGGCHTDRTGEYTRYP